MLHIDTGGNNAATRSWVDAALAHGVAFDILGLSCYTKFQGQPSRWKANFDDLALAAIPNSSSLLLKSRMKTADSNEIMRALPDRRGLGTFIWEPTERGNQQQLFDNTGAVIPEKMAPYHSSHGPIFRNIRRQRLLSRFFTRTQTRAWHSQQNHILAISDFFMGDDVALEYTVTEAGQEFDVRDVHNWAHQDSHSKQLSGADMKNLGKAIRQLPVDAWMPPRNRLVLVSFKQGTNWISRSYDRQALPDPMRKIYDIIGERFETKDQPIRDEGR